jgi:hypothetical protein
VGALEPHESEVSAIAAVDHGSRLACAVQRCVYVYQAESVASRSDGPAGSAGAWFVDGVLKLAHPVRCLAWEETGIGEALLAVCAHPYVNPQ